MLRGVVEVEDHRVDPPEVHPQPLLHPGPGIGDRDPTLGVVHAHLRRLPAERLAQGRLALQPGHVTGPEFGRRVAAGSAHRDRSSGTGL